MTAAEADAPEYDGNAPQETTKKAQVNATYQLGSPHPTRQAQKERQSTKRSGTAPRTSPKARTRSDAAPPPKNAREYSSKLKFRCGK